MRTRDFINKHCKHCKDFEPGLGCGVQWADEVCSDAICEPSYKGKDMVDRIGEYFDKLEEKKNPPSPKKKKVSENKYPIFLTEAQLGNHIRFPQPEFAYVIFDMDLSHDTEVIYIDSIWTNNDDAIKRMRILERAENEFLKKSPVVSKFKRAKLSGYSEKFPFADGLVIRRESENGLDWDPSFGIFCKRAFFNKNEFLKPFNLDEYKALIKKGKSK